MPTSVHTNASTMGDVHPIPTGVYILVTSVQGNLMAAAHTTRESAMAAAVEWVQAEAETRLTGSLAERFKKARRHVVGQGGRMEIVMSLIWGCVLS